ncbi:MAG TPA: SAM-dependent methyltransferase, partial [Myxococcota bacterium]|nr:SAM-dependent methyltransferase [Myxococcota bacterium]
ELLAVGRRAGSGAVVGRLHPAVLERALAGKRVVRLKSGDPCIFGRGGEEAEELAAAGVPFEVVPGISSAQGAAAAACIPLTHRDYASDVTFATGHAVGDTPRPGTMVLFMAARQLEANLRRVMGGGRPASTPAAFIEQATRPEQRVVVGTLGDLHERVGASADGAPALVIIGDVVRVRAAILEPA